MPLLNMVEGLGSANVRLGRPAGYGKLCIGASSRVGSLLTHGLPSRDKEVSKKPMTSGYVDMSLAVAASPDAPFSTDPSGPAYGPARSLNNFVAESTVPGYERNSSCTSLWLQRSH